jgi:hypothetical protein
MYYVGRFHTKYSLQLPHATERSQSSSHTSCTNIVFEAFAIRNPTSTHAYATIRCHRNRQGIHKATPYSQQQIRNSYFSLVKRT